MSEMAENKSRRRWFRFGLRTLLIVVLLVGVVAGMFGARLQRYRKQRAVIDELLAAGATIVFADGSEELTDDWWQFVIGEDLLDTVESVYLREDAKSVVPLAEMKNLHTLWLFESSVSDLTPLAGLQRLRVLVLADALVSDLTPLAGLHELRVLCLIRTPVSDLEPLTGLFDLETLRIFGTEVFDLTPLIGLKKVTIDLDRSEYMTVPSELDGRISDLPRS